MGNRVVKQSLWKGKQCVKKKAGSDGEGEGRRRERVRRINRLEINREKDQDNHMEKRR